MSGQHAVKHHHADEGLRSVMEGNHVLAANVLAAAEPVSRHRATSVHPLGLDLQRIAADVQDEWHARIGHLRPDRIKV